jgi:hypothetical protein
MSYTNSQISIHIATKDRSVEDLIVINQSNNMSSNTYNLRFGSAGKKGSWEWRERQMTVNDILDHLYNVFALAALDGADPAERIHDIQVFFPLAPSVIVRARDKNATHALLDYIADALYTWPECAWRETIKSQRS